MFAFKNPVQILRDRELSDATQVLKGRAAAAYLRSVSSGATLGGLPPVPYTPHLPALSGRKHHPGSSSNSSSSRMRGGSAHAGRGGLKGGSALNLREDTNLAARRVKTVAKRNAEATGQPLPDPVDDTSGAAPDATDPDAAAARDLQDYVDDLLGILRDIQTDPVAVDRDDIKAGMEVLKNFLASPTRMSVQQASVLLGAAQQLTLQLGNNASVRPFVRAFVAEVGAAGRRAIQNRRLDPSSFASDRLGTSPLQTLPAGGVAQPPVTPGGPGGGPPGSPGSGNDGSSLWPSWLWRRLPPRDESDKSDAESDAENEGGDDDDEGGDGGDQTVTALERQQKEEAAQAAAELGVAQEEPPGQAEESAEDEEVEAVDVTLPTLPLLGTGLQALANLLPGRTQPAPVVTSNVADAKGASAAKPAAAASSTVDPNTRPIHGRLASVVSPPQAQAQAEAIARPMPPTTATGVTVPPPFYALVQALPAQQQQTQVVDLVSDGEEEEDSDGEEEEEEESPPPQPPQPVDGVRRRRNALPTLTSSEYKALLAAIDKARSANALQSVVQTSVGDPIVKQRYVSAGTEPSVRTAIERARQRLGVRANNPEFFGYGRLGKRKEIEEAEDRPAKRGVHAKSFEKKSWRTAL